MNKTDIKNLNLAELKKALADIRQLPYRAQQIFVWLYQKGADNFNQMSDIPEALKDKLRQDYVIGAIELAEHLQSSDGTEKFLFKLSKGNFIETVLIHAQRRKTVCLSTQLGCKFACSFCASGLKGFIRNLKPSEITNQILFLQHNLKRKITNYVFMGMGEPLDNYNNLVKALRIMNDAQGLGIGARRITISTCGIIPGIEKLKTLGLQVNLSVSLHAANNKLRDTLIPINKRYPLEELIKACEGFINQTGRMITLEYVLISNKNDSQQDASELAAIAGRLKAKVNLIPYSQISNLNLETSQRKIIGQFMKKLMQQGINVTLRESKGSDIQASCGQLASKVKSRLAAPPQDLS
ncbi:23S rRNA (adenine(2503)-C(2))-methyltransferase RlmN [Candidatus Omnitrophota bacterium]